MARRAVIKVSVIVPVYNPGQSIDECIASLLEQSLPRAEYEVIFVDDGSTDGTGERLDAVAKKEDGVRVFHVPNSGWSGYPRNVGIDAAGGHYLYFVDNDDWVGREALERLWSTAERTQADVVVGKVVSHGQIVPLDLFECDRDDVGVDWPPLLTLLTPHKLFRRELLAEHAIRFPEGPRRLEDHVFVMRAYFAARRVAVLASYPCYHWVLRADKGNASLRRLDASYFDNMREVLDIVEEHTQPGDARLRLMAHWYRGKLLGRVGGKPFVTRAEDYQRELYEEVRRLALERFGPGVERFLPFNLVARSRLLRAGCFEGLAALAEQESRIRAKARVKRLRRRGTTLVVRMDHSLSGDGRPRFARRGDRFFWRAPEGVSAHLEEEALDATDALVRAGTRVRIRSTRDLAEYLLPVETTLRWVPDPDDADLVAPVLSVIATLDTTTAAAGAPLPAGDWELLARPTVAGFSATAGVPDPRAADRRVLTISTTASGPAVADWPRRRDALRRRLARSAPWLARAYVLARRRIRRVA